MSWEFCLQYGGVSEFYPQDGGVGVLPTRWRRVWRFYPQDGGGGDLPTRWRRLCQFYAQDGGVGDLPTRWRQCKTNKIENVNKNNVEYVLRLQCRKYLLNVTWPSDSSMSDVRHWTVWRPIVTRWTFDNAQRHVTAFRPISEAARSWSCDKDHCWMLSSITRYEL